MLIGAILILIVAILLWRASIRAMQKSRALSNFITRRKLITNAVAYFITGLLSLAGALTLAFYSFFGNPVITTPPLDEFPTVEIEHPAEETVTATRILEPVPTSTNIPPALTSTSTAPPTETSTPSPTPTNTPPSIVIDMYFTNRENLANQVQPFDQPVEREIISSDPIKYTLDTYFTGPNAREKSRGLDATWDGFLGYKSYELSDDGVLKIYLTGKCEAGLVGYTIAEPLMKTLKQLDNVNYIKLYDENGRTQNSTGEVDSIPVCLIPTPTATPSNTATATSTYTPTSTATATPTYGGPLGCPD